MLFGVEGADHMTYRVILDARTGEVLSYRNNAKDNAFIACNF